jgi:hypothetical protein
MNQYFSDFFEVPPEVIEEHGAFNISLLADLPLFIDPFLLFNSDKAEYQQLHSEIITYLKFLRDKSANAYLGKGLIEAWYRFPEIEQNWLGFSATGNKGSGLGSKFAIALHQNLHRVFTDFGKERVTQGSHLEKLCLISDGVGKDNISDFATNLIHKFLLEYTQDFAQANIKEEYRRKVKAGKVRFNYETETWEYGIYDLPSYKGEYVLLTPIDILTRDETWICKPDLLDNFAVIPPAISDDALRAQVNNYFLKVLPKDKDGEPAETKKAKREAAARTLKEYPEIIDYYIKYKEEHGDDAENISSWKVEESKRLYHDQFKLLSDTLSKLTDFYNLTGNTYEEAFERVTFLKDVIENKDGYRLFYLKGKPIEREEDIQILYRLTWRATFSDVNREVNNGRGPVDFKISRGSKDKSLVEFKLAKNSQLKRNLEKQVEIYEQANNTKKSLKVILYFSHEERDRVTRILRELNLTDAENIILIDARNDNKPSASIAA